MTNSPTLIESLKTNGGKRSITRAVFPPKAKALLHYHTQYQETFLIQSGELTIFHSGNTVLVGVLPQQQKSHTIPPGEIHAYHNLSGKDVTVDIILEPGHPGCEMTNEIAAGLERDNKLSMFQSYGGYNLLWTVLYDLTNTIPTGIPGFIFSCLRWFHGKKKIERVKRELIEKYCKH